MYCICIHCKAQLPLPVSTDSTERTFQALKVIFLMHSLSTEKFITNAISGIKSIKVRSKQVVLMLSSVLLKIFS